MISRSNKQKSRPNRNFRQAGGQRLKPCYFCKSNIEPAFKELETLRHYISDRGKIINRDRSGICRKHQRVLTKEIKRGRYLSLVA